MRRFRAAVAATVLILPGCSLTDPALFASEETGNGRAFINRQAFAAPPISLEAMADGRMGTFETVRLDPAATTFPAEMAVAASTPEPTIPPSAEQQPVEPQAVAEERPIMVASVDTGTRTDVTPVRFVPPPELVYREDREGRVILPNFPIVPVIDVAAPLQLLKQADASD